MQTANKEANKQFHKIAKKVGQVIQEHALLEPNDRVLVGLSGGKDSYLLLEVLANRQKHLPFPVELFAVHVYVKEAGYNNDLDYMREFCHKLSVPFYLIEESVDLNKDPKKAPCYVCSWHRRKYIFNLTKELNCNKLAFGHHMEDALQTLMLNMVYHGSISSMPYTLNMFEGRVQLIRPLLELEEETIIQYTELAGFPKELQKCKYDKETKRTEVKNCLKEIYKLNKVARKNMFRSMNNVFEEYIPSKLHVNP
jgi:tRNA 2-thiocytidine biosynthesis protein TtcA